jgi:hypothetical protein
VKDVAFAVNGREIGAEEILTISLLMSGPLYAGFCMFTACGPFPTMAKLFGEISVSAGLIRGSSHLALIALDEECCGAELLQEENNPFGRTSIVRFVVSFFGFFVPLFKKTKNCRPPWRDN